MILSVPVLYALAIALEQRFAAVRQDWDLRWQISNLIRFALLGVINSLAAITLQWLSSAPRQGLGQGLWADLLAGFLLATLGNALSHRCLHDSEWLWRHVHRFHHEPTRFDVAGVMWQSLGEMGVNAIVFAVLVVVVLDLPPLASTAVAAMASLYGLFQHLNLRTPAWLGLWIQRPESHRIHHQRAHHDENFSDLPWWDVVLGGYRNGNGLITDIGIPAHESASAAAPSVTSSLLPRSWRAFAAGFLLVYLPVYGLAYGPWHFLQWCHVSLLLTLIGVLRESRLLVSVAALSSPTLGLLWLVDLISLFGTGQGVHGGTAYLLDASIPLPARVLSWFHLLLPFAHAALLKRLGFAPIGLALAAMATLLVFIISSIFPDNLNYMQHWPRGQQLGEQGWQHLLTSWALFGLLALLPGMMLWQAWLRWTRRSPKRI